MRISYWSSDVCSSDLVRIEAQSAALAHAARRLYPQSRLRREGVGTGAGAAAQPAEIGVEQPTCDRLARADAGALWRRLSLWHSALGPRQRRGGEGGEIGRAHV